MKKVIEINFDPIHQGDIYLFETPQNDLIDLQIKNIIINSYQELVDNDEYDEMGIICTEAVAARAAEKMTGSYMCLNIPAIRVTLK